MSDPSFERSRLEEYYALHFKYCKDVYNCVYNCNYMPIICSLFKYFSKDFCKGSWLVYSNSYYSNSLLKA